MEYITNFMEGLKMTKVERITVQSMINRISEIEERRDKAFHDLQEANGRINGDCWCSAKMNHDALIESGKANNPYIDNLYEIYVSCCAQIDLIRDFGGALADIGFWK